VVTRNGRPVAVIVGVHDEDETERLLMAHSPHLRGILEKSRQQFRQGQWLSERTSGRSSSRAGGSRRRRGASGSGRSPRQPQIGHGRGKAFL
jgi:hypothetical protein